MTLLDKIVNDQAGHTMANIGETKSLSIELERCLATLSATQRVIVCSFYGIGTSDTMSLDTIGWRLNLSTERVRQLKNKAIAQLQKDKSVRLLKPFLG